MEAVSQGKIRRDQRGIDCAVTSVFLSGREVQQLVSVASCLNIIVPVVRELMFALSFMGNGAPKPLNYLVILNANSMKAAVVPCPYSTTSHVGETVGQSN
jgi:hypothetical protein